MVGIVTSSRLHAHFNFGISFNSVTIDSKPYFTWPAPFFSPQEKLEQKEGNGVGFGLNLVELVAWDILCHLADY